MKVFEHISPHQNFDPAKSRKSLKWSIGPLHSGSWYGLPDLHLTEIAGNLLGTSRSPQGGSDVFANSYPAQPNPVQENLIYKSQQVPTYSFNPAGSRAVLGTRTTTAPINNNPIQTGPSQDDLNRQLEEIYSPGMSYLDQLAAYTQGSERDTALASLDTSMKDLSANLASQQETALGKYGKEETLANQQFTSAYQDAIRNFKSLQQQGMSRFGLGSSAGRGIGEIANQEFLKNVGRLSNTLGQNLSTLADNRQQLFKWYADQSASLKAKEALLKREIDDQVRAKLLQVDQMRGALQSAKAASKMQLLQEAANAARQIENYRIMNEMQLNQFKDQKLLEIGTQYGALMSSQKSPQPINAIPSQYLNDPIAPTQKLQGFRGSLFGTEDELSNLYA